MSFKISLSEYKGKKLRATGDIGTYSFFSNKNMSTAKGGILISNNEENLLTPEFICQ